MADLVSGRNTRYVFPDCLCAALWVLGVALVLSRQPVASLLSQERPTQAELSRPSAGEVKDSRADGNPADLDADGVTDALEDRLAERFAPIVFHGERETTFPTSVDVWLERARLLVAGDPSGIPRLVQVGPLRQSHLLGHEVALSGITLSSSGSRSRGKQISFVLDNVAPSEDAARPHPGDWITYVHSYPNTGGGLTLQVPARVHQ